MDRAIIKEAEKRAELAAPAPKRGPVVVGTGGFLITGVVLTVFMAFTGLDSEGFQTAVAWTSAVGFAVPFGYVWFQRQNHSRAYAAAFEDLRAARDARRT